LEVRRKFGFTKKLLDKLPLPANAQRAYFYDSLTRGLALAVSPAGKKVFVLYRKVDGRPERITIGPYPDLTIEQARGKAAELNGAIARGDNPATKRRMVRDEATLGDLFATYLEYHAKPHTKSAGDYESTFNLHLHSWKLRKISEIRKTDVVSLHARIGAKSGKYTANRVTELLSAMFNKAIAWDWKGVNPASKVKRFQERQRERFLQPDELPAFWKALQEEENKTVRDYVLLSLLTGARRANVQAMRWSEINSQTATWTIPETKNGEALTVALSAPAIAILETRKEASKSQFVLPGVGESGHLIEPKSAWKRILKRAAEIQKKDWLKSHPGKAAADFEKECETAGFRDLRIHDLRRTLGSWQAAQGASLQIIGKSLGHKSLQATQVYSRLNLDPVRASVNAATDAMLLAAKTPAALLVDGNER
jgi:integrase